MPATIPAPEETQRQPEREPERALELELELELAGHTAVPVPVDTTCRPSPATTPAPEEMPPQLEQAQEPQALSEQTVDTTCRPRQATSLGLATYRSSSIPLFRRQQDCPAWREKCVISAPGAWASVRFPLSETPEGCSA